MSTWIIRAGRYGETEHIALQHGVAPLGWDALPDLSAVRSREDLVRIACATYPNEKQAARDNWVDQVWASCSLIQIGEELEIGTWEGGVT